MSSRFCQKKYKLIINTPLRLIKPFHSGVFKSEYRFFFFIRENACSEAKLKHTEDLQEKLFNEIVGRLKKDGNGPLLLYGNGSNSATMDPFFRSSLLSLLEWGVAFALAHVRGSQMLGRE